MSAPTLSENWVEILLGLEPGWDGEKGKKISFESLDAVGKIHVVPCSDGGLQLELHAGGIDFEMEFTPEGEIGSLYVARAKPQTS